MPCKTCQKVKENPILVQSGLPYSLSTGITTVYGRDGKHYAIKSCLIPAMQQPKGGWGVVFYVKGQKHEINGKPREIFLKVKQLFDLNEILYSDLEIWLNLNIQWTERAVERYQKVRHSDLLKIAIPNF